MDFSNLKLAQCSNFKMLKSILDDGIIYFEQKILLSLTNLSYHSLNILINMSPYSTCIFHHKNSCLLLLSIGERNRCMDILYKTSMRQTSSLKLKLTRHRNCDQIWQNLSLWPFCGFIYYLAKFIAYFFRKHAIGQI